MSERVPDNMETTSLGEVLQAIEGGGTPSRNNPSFWGGDIPWATVKDLKNVRLSQTEESITKIGLDNSSSRLIPKGSVIIATRMAVGKAVTFDKDVSINQDLKALFPKDCIYSEYLLQWFLHSKDLIEALGTGSTVKGVRLEVLKGVPFLSPPLPEQKKIASILTSVDEVIETTQKQIDKLQDLKKATMNELLTKGIGHTEFKDSELGRIPKSWEVKAIGDFVLDYKGGAALTPSDFADVGFPVIPKKAVQFGGEIILGTNRTFCQQSFAKENKSHIVDREYIIATLRDLVPSGPSIGLMGLLIEDEQFVLAQGVYGFRLSAGLSKSFLSYLSNTGWYRAQMRRLMVGSTQVHIRTGEFLDTQIPIPSVSEQLDISSIIDGYENLIKNKMSRLDKQNALKKSLMQDLLTGRVRVESGNQ